MTLEERIWLLISRAVSGDISREEQEELQNILQFRPDLRADYENIVNLKLTSQLPPSTNERRAIDNGLEKFNEFIADGGSYADHEIFNHTGLKPIGGKRHIWWMLAASLVIATTISGYLLRKVGNTEAPVQEASLATNYGKRIHTVLPDGSVVWLNGGSSIKYTQNLKTNGKREVVLNGEAFFDVRHDAKHPFIVHAGKVNIEVLGTAFNVKAYLTDVFMETTLIRGKVEILNDAKPGSNIVLYPNEKVIINTRHFNSEKVNLVLPKKVAVDSVNAQPDVSAIKPAMIDGNVAETAWLDNKLSFKKENFYDLAKQLERWYGVVIVFDNNIYLPKHFTGTFNNQGIDEVMRALQLTQPFHYSINNNQIHIW
jgi:ferric-dicitrate binding protein FerR (iron transport regulator)